MVSALGRLDCSLVSRLIFSLYIKLGSNVNPPKDVQEKEQFRTLHQWIQQALWTSDQAAQVK